MQYYPPRFYGGHYDSVKQGFIRDRLYEDNLWKPELLKLYTTRLRLDILLAGNVVLTDSQYYDGSFFHALVSDEEKRKDFSQFLKDSSKDKIPIIEIRRRPFGLLSLLKKPFTFSSAISGNDRSEICNAMGKLTPGEIDSKTTKKILNAINDKIDNSDTKITFQEISENLIYLDEAPNRIFQKWSNTPSLKDLIKSAKRTLDFKVEMTGNKEIDEVLNNIEIEMNKNYPNRTKIDTWIRSAKDSLPAFSNILDSLYNKVCQVFNLAFAKQHHCNAWDLGETPLLGKSIADMVENFSKGILDAIAEESWREFYKRLTIDPLKTSWKNWRESVMKANTNFKKPLSKFSKNILNSYGQTSRMSISQFTKNIIIGLGLIIGGGSSNSIYTTPAITFGSIIGSMAITAGLASIGFTIYDVVKEKKGEKQKSSNLIQFGLSINRKVK